MKPFSHFIFLLFFVASCSNSDDQNNHEGQEVTDNDTIAEMTSEPEIDINLTLCDDIPRDCEFEGKVVDAYEWKDLNGTNYFIRTIGEMEEGVPQYSDEPAYTQWIYAYHFIEVQSGKISLSREIKDFVENCEFDLMIGHELNAITLTDLDDDQIGEITFIYRLTCTSDVSPSEQKLMLLENGDKYALRGFTEVMGEGGEYEMDPAFDKAPKSFLEHAKKLWSENITEYDFEL